MGYSWAFSTAGMSHNRTSRSQLPDTSVRPSGLYPTDDTSPVWPSGVVRLLPDFTSHSLIVLSSLPEATVLPSGLKATEDTEAA